MRTTALAACLLLASVSFASQASAPAPAGSDPAMIKANQALDLVIRDKYAEVAAMFSPQLRSPAIEDKLRSGLQKYLAGLGPIRKRLQAQVQNSGELHSVVLPVQFEKATLEFISTVNSAGALMGFYVRPVADASAPWASPDYSKPDSFRAQDVVIGHGAWQLPGTLTLPAAKSRVAAVVLVHGSGPNDRDESLGPQKPFRDLAEGLASRGIAVLRYEKRTRYAVARLGSIKNLTVQEETIDDALAAVEFLRSRTEIDPARVFVAGHSLGGYLIPRIGRRDPKLGGLISLAGSARPIEDLVVEQYAYLASLQGNPAEALAAVEKAKADAQKIKTFKEGSEPPDGLLAAAPPSYWLDLQGYDPAAEARTLKQPMLFLQGERDYQVTMTDFGIWKEALKDRANVRFRSFPKLNHLFQAGEGKSTPGEYMSKPSHVDSEVVDEIASWIYGTR